MGPLLQQPTAPSSFHHASGLFKHRRRCEQVWGVMQGRPPPRSGRKVAKGLQATFGTTSAGRCFLDLFWKTYVSQQMGNPCPLAHLFQAGHLMREITDRTSPPLAKTVFFSSISVSHTQTHPATCLRRATETSSCACAVRSDPRRRVRASSPTRVGGGAKGVAKGPWLPTHKDI